MKKRISAALVWGILLIASALCGCRELEDVTAREQEDAIVKTDGIYIPDANFKSYLIDNFDTDDDGEISEEEALAVAEIDISGNSVVLLKFLMLLKSLVLSRIL